MKQLYFIFFILLCINPFICSGDPGYEEIMLQNRQEGIELVIQEPHAYPVTSCAISPMDNAIATASYDKTIKLWNFSGRVLRTMTGHTAGIIHLSFSPEGDQIVTTGLDNTVRVWTKQGRLVSSFSAHTGATIKAFFCINNKILTIGTSEKKFSYDEYADEVRLWSLSGVLEKKLEMYDMVEDVHTAGVSPDGRYFVLSIYNRGTNIIDIETGETILNPGTMKHSTFSSDSRHVIGIHTKGLKSECAVYTIPGGSLSLSYTITGDEIKKITIDDSFTTMALGYDNRIIIQKLKTGSRISEIADSSGIFYFAFKKESQQLLCFSGNTCSTWDIKGTRISSFPLFTRNPPGNQCIEVHPHGGYFAGIHTTTLSLWKTDGTFITSINAQEPDTVYFPELEFTPDGKYLAYNTAEDIAFMDMKGSFIKTLFHRRLMNTSSPNTYLAAKNDDGFFEFYPAGATEPEKKIKPPSEDDFVISADGTLGISAPGAYPGTEALLFDFSKKKYSAVFSPFKSIMDITISYDNTHLLSADLTGDEYLENSINLWSVDGKREKTFYSGKTGSVAMSRDNNYIAIGTEMNDIRLYSRDGTLKKVFTGHTQAISDLTFDPQSSHILSISPDQTMKIRDINTGGCVTFIVKGEEWVIYTDDGYFDASQNGGNLVGITKGISSYGIDQFALWNNRPDILMERLGAQDVDKKQHYLSLYKTRLKKMGIESEKLYDLHVPQAEILDTVQSGKSIQLKFKISDGRYNLHRYNVYVNDVPLFGAYGRIIDGKENTIIENLELTYGTNKIEVSCWNEKGAESYRALTFAGYNQAEKKDLYFIGFGVSEYKDKDLNLKYAHKDVNDLALLFKSMKREYENIYIHTYINEEVTKNNIQAVKLFLTHANPQDTLVLFISGHGVHDTDKNATYYYLTHNTDVNNLQNTAAHFELIENILQGIPPRHKLFLLDTCESGDINEETQKNYFSMADSKGIRPRAARPKTLIVRKKNRSYVFEKKRFIYNDLMRRSGAIVFSSSKGGEFSYESDKFENGLFTEEIINGLLLGKADTNKDGIVMTDELRFYVSAAVPKLAEGAQNPTVDRDNIYVKFGFPAGNK
ncbi:MAG: caspase family protein [Spirochaetales bacterium]|nr:caspase family protein [Spirochaetales bacterium]